MLSGLPQSPPPPNVYELASVYIIFLSTSANKHAKNSRGIIHFQADWEFKNQKPSKPLVSFQSEWKTFLKQMTIEENVTSFWLSLEIRSPYEVCKISFQNSPAPSCILLRWETPVISPALEDGTLGF